MPNSVRIFYRWGGGTGRGGNGGGERKKEGGEVFVILFS